jgi:hypothetical protein
MASAFVVIFANDVPYSGEIKRHELGHILCPEWHHPKGYQANGKAWPPPAYCFKRKLPGKIYWTGVSTAEARARCEGIRGNPMLGCGIEVEDQ